jgi:diguanylate cyclase (GGDEF)-like protein/PAS domain S-box-containing protein
VEPDATFYRNLLDSLAEGVYIVGGDGRITFWNRAAERITGYAVEAVLGQRCSDGLLCHRDEEGRDLCRLGCPLAATRADGVEREARVFLRHSLGHRVPVVIRSAPVRDARGEIVGAVETFTDDSARIEALRRSEELEALAYRDPLTGLGNRRYAEEVITARLEEFGRTGTRFGVLFADLDHFKALNDRHGHDAGDKALRLIALTFTGSLRAYDFAGRWGGEELIGVISRVEEQELTRVAERFRELTATSPMPCPGGGVPVTISIGATIVREGDTPATLVQRADALMYRSKAAGRNRVTVG